MNRSSSIRKSTYLLYFVITFSVLLLLSFTVLFFIEYESRQLIVKEVMTNETRVVNLENDFLGKEFSMILADLHYLHHAFEEQLENETNYNEIADNWTEFSNHRHIYDQIRFIDKNGDEKIRINLDESGSFRVADNLLQNKKDRYYFYETIELNEETVHMSPLDLNVEAGQIEIPHKPMMRFSTPIYNKSGDLMGIIVLNYLAENFLSSFRELGQNSDGEIVLLNSDSYWLSSDDEKNNWNFMFDDKLDRNFSGIFPNEWDAIINGSGQLTTKNGIFTFEKVDINRKLITNDGTNHPQSIYFGDKSWYIVSIVKNNVENSHYFDDRPMLFALNVLKKNAVFFIMMGFISGFVGLLVIVNRRNYNEVKYFSEFDPLTKLYNRRAGIRKLNTFFIRDERRRFLQSLCYIDINGLKQVNDTLGHKYGDELIITVTEVIKSVIREGDFAIRLGGDEFLIVFNGIEAAIAESVWDRIIQKYVQINVNEDRPYIISVSHGIVDYDGKVKSQIDELLNVADEKMYKEKAIMKENFNVIRHRE